LPTLVQNLPTANNIVNPTGLDRQQSTLVLPCRLQKKREKTKKWKKRKKEKKQMPMPWFELTE
jgi:hypothetical protein